SIAFVVGVAGGLMIALRHWSRQGMRIGLGDPILEIVRKLGRFSGPRLCAGGRAQAPPVAAGGLAESLGQFHRLFRLPIAAAGPLATATLIFWRLCRGVV